MSTDKNVFIIDCEGAIESAAKQVYKAMMDRKKTKVNLTYFCTTEFMHLMFLRNLAQYLQERKAKKVDHVSIDIFIDQGETDG